VLEPGELPGVGVLDPGVLDPGVLDPGVLDPGVLEAGLLAAADVPPGVDELSGAGEFA